MDGWDLGEGASPLEMDNFSEAATEAEAEGYEVLVADDQELFFDLDNDQQMQVFEARFPRFEAIFQPSSVERWRSKSGVGWHVRLKVYREGMTVAHKAAIQAVLGSDPLKELLTVARELECGEEIRGKTIRLFKPKNAVIENRWFDGSWKNAEEQKDYEFIF